MAPSALSPLTARGHPETRLVSVSIPSFLHTWFLDEILNYSAAASYLLTYIIAVSFMCVSLCVTCVCVCMCVCVWLPVAVVMSRVLSSLLPGECVWGESCPWLSWTQMCWTACTRWVVSETESSSRVICNVKSKHFFSALNMTVFLSARL